ncbi:MAG: DUF5018 domain-containing protein [Bacteroidales bacterium]|jgi:hypothetical protein|nr:DUF5018 domain-containing protein [Bacteroidales bacterium]
MKIRLLAIVLMAVSVGLGACSKKNKSSEKKILGFEVNGAIYQINESNHTVTYTYPKMGIEQWENMPTGAVSPKITISDKATIDPPASKSQTFVDNTVLYTVTAEDGTIQSYKVQVDKQLE